MIKRLTATLKNIANDIIDAPVVSSLYRNAYRGWPNSQGELAFYLLEKKKDYLEAYVWAEVAHCNGNSKAIAIKRQAEENLKPEQIKVAWDKAREYKRQFLG